MKNVKVTFIMMAYNTEEYIAKAIESVLNQTEPNIELYIRNNGSTDGTGEIIRAYASRDSRIHYVENRTNNRTEDGRVPFQPGWWPVDEKTAGEYISILDSDDYLETTFTEQMYAAAKGYDADLTMAGATFVNEDGQLMGVRNPPSIQIDDLSNLTSGFAPVYNVLRTWWGKLFKSSYFFKYYQECWGFADPLPYSIDTVVSLRYLERCKRLVCIEKPLYYFLSRSSSTYSSLAFDLFRIMEARGIHAVGLRTIQALDIACQENLSFLQSVHWGYFRDTLNGIYSPKTPSNFDFRFWRLTDMLNEPLVQSYLPGNFETIYSAIAPYIRESIQTGSDNLWTFYLARLVYLFDNLNEENMVYFPVLLSCLCDPTNRNRFGDILLLSFLNSNRSLSAGQRWLSIWPPFYPLLFDHADEVVGEINRLDHHPDLSKLEEELIQCMNEADIEKACDLIETISRLSPLNRVAFYYRITLAAAIQDYSFAGMLAATAKFLWPNDRDIQQLYWEISEIN
jgi:glycosyltransferase involved in cell wall biosynthesis